MKPRDLWIYDGFVFDSVEKAEGWDHKENKKITQVREVTNDSEPAQPDTITLPLALFDELKSTLDILDCEYDNHYSGVTREVVKTSTHRGNCRKCAVLRKLEELK